MAKQATIIYVEKVPKKVAIETGKLYVMYMGDYTYAKTKAAIVKWLNKRVEKEDRPFKVKLVKWNSAY